MLAWQSLCRGYIEAPNLHIHSKEKCEPTFRVIPELWILLQHKLCFWRRIHCSLCNLWVIVTTDLWAVTMAFTFPKMKFDTLNVPSLGTPKLTVPNCSWVCCVLWQLSALLLVSYTDHKMQLLSFRDLACLNPRKLRKQSLKQGCLLLLENVIQQLLQTWKLPCRCTGFLKGC